MKVFHRPELDYLSLDFSSEPEAKTSYENGIIVRYDKKGHVVGIDITDSMNFFLSNDTVDMKQAVRILGFSESTMRRLIKNKKIKFTKPNGKDYQFKKSDLILFKKAG